MDINEQEIWLRAYTAAISNPNFKFTRSDYIGQANQAVEDFYKRFPPFQFHSEETKK